MLIICLDELDVRRREMLAGSRVVLSQNGLFESIIELRAVTLRGVQKNKIALLSTSCAGCCI